MVSKIIAVIGALLMSFWFYMVWQFCVHDKDENNVNKKHPIFYMIYEFFAFFLAVSWIIMLFINLGAI